MRSVMNRWLLASVVGLAAFAQAPASSITFLFNTVHSGATPGGTAPWATMTMSDIIGGGVQVSLTNNATNPRDSLLDN